MKRLGEILLDWGVVAISELHTGLDACRRSGGRLGTQLLKFGFVDEHSLLEALSEQCNVPPVSERMLRRAPLEVRNLLPPKVARRLEAVPFARNGELVRVALANPSDPAKREEIARLTGLRVEPFVATETAIVGLISELEDDLLVEEAVEVVDSRRAADAWAAWEQLWAPPAVPPDRILLPPRRRSSAPRPLLATFADLEPIGADIAAEPEQDIDEPTFRQRLAQVRHRDEAGRLLVRLAAGWLGRVCLFAVHRGTVVGWMARGQCVAVDDVQSFSIALEQPTLFRDLFRRPEPYLGPVPQNGENDGLRSVLGDPAPEEVLVVPVRVKDRTVAFLLGDTPGDPHLTVPVDELASAVRKVGAALEILIIRNKILA